MSNESTRNGWTVAIACCLVNFIQSGIARLAPLLYVESITRYNVDRKEASFPFVLVYILRNLSGPFVGYLGNIIGLRTVTVIGCLISAFGIGACFFAKDIMAVIILWGVIYGIGLGFGTNLLQQIINMSYDKDKIKANGLSMAGCCLGAIVMPLIVEPLLRIYGISGTFLITSAIALNGVPAAMLLRLQESNKNSDICKTVQCVPKNERVRYEGKIPDPKQNIQSNNNVEPNSTVLPLQNACSLATVDKHTVISEGGQQFCSLIDGTTQSNISGLKPKEHFTETVTLKDSLDCGGEIPYWIDNSKQLNLINSKRDFRDPQEVCPPLMSSKGVQKKSSGLRTFRILLDPVFLAIAITQSASFFIVTTVWTVVIDFSRDRGVVPNQEIYVLLTLTLTDIVARLGLGWVIDGGYMSETNYNAVLLFCLGLSSIIFTLSTGFVLVISAVTFFAVVSGGIIIAFPGPVNQFIEAESRTMAMASKMILYVPLCLTTSPMIGYFRSTLGSYNGIFYIHTCIAFLCCGIVLLLPSLSRRRKKMKQFHIDKSKLSEKQSR